MVVGDANAMAKSKNRGPRMPGVLTKEDMALWRAVTRTDRTMSGRGRIEKTEKKPSETVFQQKENEKTVPSERLANNFSVKTSQPKGEGLDRRTATRLRRGQILIDSSLDLHGLTQREAHSTLANTLTAAQARGERCVLVITGKGLGREGVLQRTDSDPLDYFEGLGHLPRPRDGDCGCVHRYEYDALSALDSLL